VREIIVYNDHIEGIEDFDEAEFMEMMGDEDSMDELIGYFKKYYGLPHRCFLYIWADKVETKKAFNPW
jgi:hypothetical protein